MSLMALSMSCVFRSSVRVPFPGTAAPAAVSSGTGRQDQDRNGCAAHPALQRTHRKASKASKKEGEHVPPDLSLLQFQNWLRLQETRRLLLGKDLDTLHFNREYKRLFGEPPLRDAERLRPADTAELTT